jgi:hypothetical protein
LLLKITWDCDCTYTYFNGSTSSNQQAIRDHVAHFYESLFIKPYSWRPRLDNLAFDSLDAVEASSLELHFEEKEVLEVIKGMNRDKASGPDGFSIAFYQDCWDVIKIDLMGVFQDFHTHSKFVKSINATFLALIPKKSGAVDLKDFRPILVL